MIENYLEILESSLCKKLDILDEIITYNKLQEQLLKNKKLSLEELDANMNQKDTLIQKLTELDEGFEHLYARIKAQLQSNGDAYKDQIRNLQGQISQVMEKSISIQAQETGNKKLLEDYFASERSQLRQGRKSSKAAYGYYRSMSNSNVIPSQFLDQKK